MPRTATGAFGRRPEGIWRRGPLLRLPYPTGRPRKHYCAFCDSVSAYSISGYEVLSLSSPVYSHTIPVNSPVYAFFMRQKTRSAKHAQTKGARFASSAQRMEATNSVVYWAPRSHGYGSLLVALLQSGGPVVARAYNSVTSHCYVPDNHGRRSKICRRVGYVSTTDCSHSGEPGGQRRGTRNKKAPKICSLYV